MFWGGDGGMVTLGMWEGIIMMELSCASANGPAPGFFDLAGVAGGVSDDRDWVD